MSQAWANRRAWGMRGAVKRAGPGVADADRPQSGSFASLLDQILKDDEALDALVFAYRELGDAEARGELARAVLQDAADPIPALSALLAAEPTPALQRRLAGWIAEREGVCREAWLEGTETDGRARLVQRLPGLQPESLCLVWKHHEIECVEIEARGDMSSAEPGGAADLDRADLDDAVERLTPLLWRHIRRGGSLPTGIERFAPFFAPWHTPGPDGELGER